jgi:hypothetical protein
MITTDNKHNFNIKKLTIWDLSIRKPNIHNFQLELSEKTDDKKLKKLIEKTLKFIDYAYVQNKKDIILYILDFIKDDCEREYLKLKYI